MKGLLRILLDLLLRFVRTLDLPLLAALLALMGIGLVTQFSAGNESLRGVAMQGAFYCVGLGALWVASRLPAHLLKQATPAIFYQDDQGNLQSQQGAPRPELLGKILGKR